MKYSILMHATRLTTNNLLDSLIYSFQSISTMIRSILFIQLCFIGLISPIAIPLDLRMHLHRLYVKTTLSFAQKLQEKTIFFSIIHMWIFCGLQLKKFVVSLPKLFYTSSSTQ